MLQQGKARQNQTGFEGQVGRRDRVWRFKIQEITVPFQRTLSPQNTILKTLEFSDDDDDDDNKVELMFIGHSVYAWQYYLHFPCIISLIPEKDVCSLMQQTEAQSS